MEELPLMLIKIDETKRSAMKRRRGHCSKNKKAIWSMRSKVHAKY
jgi:hypothetical protein